MLGGYRRIIFAVGLTLSTYHPNVEAKGEQNDRSGRIAQSLDNIASTYREQAERSERAPESQPCKSGEDKRDSDLCAQWKAADAAANSAWWTSAGTWVSGISGFFVVIALFLAFQSNRIARTSAHAQLRPYVHEEGIIWDKRMNGGDEFLDLKVRFRNAGQTPAKDLQMGGFCYLTEPDDTSPEINMILDVKTPKQPLGPASAVDVPVMHPLNEDQANEVWAGKKKLFVCAIATYQDPFSNITRKTTCHYSVTIGKENGNFSYLWWNNMGSFNTAT